MCRLPIGSLDIFLMVRGSWWATVRWKIAGNCIGPRIQMRSGSSVVVVVAVFVVFESQRWSRLMMWTPLMLDAGPDGSVGRGRLSIGLAVVGVAVALARVVAAAVHGTLVVAVVAADTCVVVVVVAVVVVATDDAVAEEARRKVERDEGPADAGAGCC